MESTLCLWIPVSYTSRKWLKTILYTVQNLYHQVHNTLVPDCSILYLINRNIHVAVRFFGPWELVYSSWFYKIKLILFNFYYRRYRIKLFTSPFDKCSITSMNTVVPPVALFVECAFFSSKIIWTFAQFTDGFVDVSEILKAFSEHGFAQLTRFDIENIVNNDQKGRYELNKDFPEWKIRATQGHTLYVSQKNIPQNINKWYRFDIRSLQKSCVIAQQLICFFISCAI